MSLQVPKIPTTDWAVSCFERIYQSDNPEQLDAFLELLGGLAPTLAEAKHKHEIFIDLIEYAYKKTGDCEQAARRYIGMALFVFSMANYLIDIIS